MAIISNVSKFPITLTSADGDSCTIPVGKNIPVADKFMVNVLPGIVVIKGVEKQVTYKKPEATAKKRSKKEN